MAEFGRSFTVLKQKLPEILSINVNTMGNFINKAIQDGLKSGTDINGDFFQPLKDSSKDARARKTLYYGKHSGSGTKPLMWSENLRKTKKVAATPKKLNFLIEMNASRGFQYGAMHNQKGGYVTSSKSAVPGKKVPQRKWFGIPKEMQSNGNELRKALNNIGKNLKAHYGGKSVVKLKI